MSKIRDFIGENLNKKKTHKNVGLFTGISINSN